MQSAADALARDEADRRGLVVHLLQRRRVRLEVELRDEAQRAHEPQRILGEARRRHRPQDALLEILLPAERIDELARREPARHRVDGEVATAHVVLDRERRVGDDLEVVAAGAGAHLLARRRELDARRSEPPHRRVARMETHADEAVGDDEVLDAAVRLERALQAVGVDARDEEVGVLRLEPEQLVADGAADEIRVEVQAADVLLELLPHEPILAAATATDVRLLRSRRARPTEASATSTVERAGGRSPTCAA